jgi:hypothetical protein
MCNKSETYFTISQSLQQNSERHISQITTRDQTYSYHCANVLLYLVSNCCSDGRQTFWVLRLPGQWLIWHHVVWYTGTNISEECRWPPTKLHGITSQKPAVGLKIDTVCTVLSRSAFSWYLLCLHLYELYSRCERSTVESRLWDSSSELLQFWKDIVQTF